MNRTILITSIVTAVACGATFVLRANNNSKLEGQVEEQRTIVRQLEATAGMSPGKETRLSALLPQRDQTAEAIAQVRAATTPEQRIERAHGRIDALIADLGNVNQSPDKLFRVLPDVLRLLKDLDLEEMIAVADKIDAPISMGRGGDGKGMIKLILLLLAGEQDPERILDKIQKEGEDDAVSMALSSLAAKNPQAAIAWMKGSDASDSDKSHMLNLIALKTLNNDFDAGLAMLRENGSVDIAEPIGLLSQMPLERKALDQAVAALRRPENADLKPAIVNMVLNTCLFHSGVEEARAAVAQYDLPKEEVAAFLDQAGPRFAQSSPAAIIDWMVDIQPADMQEESVPRMVSRWANRDYNAAGKFLGEMQPSPVRDLATEQFAKTVVPLDPEAAAIWALEINDAERRSETIEFVAKQWRDKDNAAAAAWLEKEGITIE